ncbi:MAG: rhodanese-like domain-containing protein [Bacteroidota bacterium]
MKKILIVFILLVTGCSSPAGEAPEIQPDQFKSRIEQGAALIDVRSPEEYANGHIAGSQNIDIKDPEFLTKIQSFDKIKPYAVYCASGVRSGKAAGIMRENGFTNVFTLSGGLKAWREKGLPLE